MVARKRYIHVMRNERGDPGWNIIEDRDLFEPRFSRILPGRRRVYGPSRDRRWGSFRNHLYSNKAAAIAAAERLADRINAQVVIHTKSGKIQERRQFRTQNSPRKPREVLYPYGNTTVGEKRISTAVEKEISDTGEE